MAHYKKQTKTPQQKEQKFPLGLLLPLIFIVSVLPLITYYTKYASNLDQYDWFIGWVIKEDFFLYAKMIWLLICSGCIVFCLVYLIFAEEKKPVWNKILIPLAVYCGIAFLSACLSKYPYFSFHGIYEQLESIWVLLSYALIIYYSFMILRSEAAVKRMLFWFVVGIAVMAALGMSQVLAHDFLQTLPGQKLMVHGSADIDVEENPLVFKFGNGRAYLTLHNPNYVGYYVALIIPLLVGLTFAANKIWQRVVYLGLAAVMMLVLFSSQSRAGVIAILVSLAVMLLCMRKLFIKNWIVTIGGLSVFAIAFIVVNILNENILLDRMKSMFNMEPEYHALKSIETLKDNVTITYNDSSLLISMEKTEDGADQLILRDDTGAEPANQQLEDGTIQITDERFPFTCAVVRDSSFQGFRVNIEGIDWHFTNLMRDYDSSYYYCSVKYRYKTMKLTKQEKTLSFLEDHYHFANMRGYIWARTLPLLKKYFLLGSGPDTFMIVFPNNDMVGLYNSGHWDEIVTKPHCMYLQIAVQTGIPSLIALLIFFGWYLVDSLKLYWKNDYKEYLPKIGVSLFISVIGYLILATTNDACIAVTPIFYCMLGMGLAINHKLKQQ